MWLELDGLFEPAPGAENGGDYTGEQEESPFEIGFAIELVGRGEDATGEQVGGAEGPHDEEEFQLAAEGEKGREQAEGAEDEQGVAEFLAGPWEEIDLESRVVTERGDEAERETDERDEGLEDVTVETEDRLHHTLAEPSLYQAPSGFSEVKNSGREDDPLFDW